MRAADINVVNHQFCVTEFGNDMGELPDDAPNGLIAANGTGCLILTGLHTGRVNVTVEPLQAAPRPSQNHGTRLSRSRSSRGREHCRLGACTTVPPRDCQT
jgi:hypothetical protein